VHYPGTTADDICDPYREGFPDDSPITFTHVDLNLASILVSEDSPCRIHASIDWKQSGWYPAYWEWRKAEYTVAYESEWAARYLPRLLDKETYVEAFEEYASAFGHRYWRDPFNLDLYIDN
jgi:hypothetical protein